MSQKIYNSLIKVLNCKISTNISLLGRNPAKLKVKVDLDSSSQVKSLEAIAKKNRELWEKRNVEISAVEGKRCSDDVFFMKEYEAIKYDLSGAISMHKEHCLEPSMLDVPYAILKANFVLNMKTKKGGKTATRMGGVLIPPHELTFEPKKRILAFCKSPEDIQIALDSGAIEAGELTIINKLLTSVLNIEEFDQVVCHLDCVNMLGKIRPILREKMIVKSSNRCGNDIKKLVETFMNGHEYEAKKLDGVPEEAQLTIPIGEISWPLKTLEENFLAFTKDILANVSSQLMGDAIIRCTLVCPPSDEQFQINITNYVEELKKPTIKPPVRNPRPVEEQPLATV